MKDALGVILAHLDRICDPNSRLTAIIAAACQPPIRYIACAPIQRKLDE